MTAMQPQPVFDQTDNDLVRYEPAASKHFACLLPQRGTKIAFTAQDSARRRNWNPKLARDHFCLRPFPRTRRAEKNKPPFHLPPVKKNGDSCDHEHGNAHVQPHKGAALCCVAASIGRAIKRSPPDPSFSKEAIVMPLNQMCL